jgi:alpha-1,3-rhamnosyl/mannosyltransferase
MKIGFNAAVLVPPYSGVAVAVEGAARALARELGPELTLFLPLDSGSEESLFGEARVMRIPVARRSRWSRVMWEQRMLPQVARGLHLDLLHAPAYVMPLRWRGPTVATVYDLLTLTHPEWCRRGNAGHFRLLLPATLSRAVRVVVPSQATYEEALMRPEMGPGRLRTVPLGVDEWFYPAPTAEVARVRERYGLAQPYVLVVGNLEPKKNLPGTVRIFSRLVKAFPHELVIAGGAGWGDQRPFRRAVEELPPGCVNLLGYVPREDLPALYSGAELFLQLSWHEGFGLPPLEAMACGTAAVVSDRGALPEIAGPGALVVDPAEEESAAQAIAGLLGNEAARRELAARGQARAAEFTWARHARGLLGVYREALDERSG